MPISKIYLEDFDYNLDPKLIATHPVHPRDHSRMMVLDEGVISDRYFYNLPEYFDEGDVLVFNNSKVLPAKLQSGSIQINLIRNIEGNKWQIMAKPLRKLKVRQHYNIAEDFNFQVINKDETFAYIEFADDHLEKIYKYGAMPIPPYIEKKRNTISQIKSDESFKSQSKRVYTKVHDLRPDSKKDEGSFKNGNWYKESFKSENWYKEECYYQTVYAKEIGSVAAPTAGLHFTDNILQALRDKNVQLCEVTLHVGAGTFLPVKANNIADHKMHAEYAEISEEAVKTILKAKEKGKKITAVGTTSCRLLETAALNTGVLKSFKGDTDIFITPGFKFNVVDNLITNFHLPKSTLMMLVSAFAGYDNIMRAYKHAAENGYRFYSYGDSCFLRFASK